MYTCMYICTIWILVNTTIMYRYIQYTYTCAMHSHSIQYPVHLIYIIILVQYVSCILSLQLLPLSQHKPLGHTQSMWPGKLLRRVQQVSSTTRSSGPCLLQITWITSIPDQWPSLKKAMHHLFSSETSSLPWSIPSKYVSLQTMGWDSGAIKSEHKQIQLVRNLHALMASSMLRCS